MHYTWGPQFKKGDTLVWEFDKRKYTEPKHEKEVGWGGVRVVAGATLEHTGPAGWAVLRRQPCGSSGLCHGTVLAFPLPTPAPTFTLPHCSCPSCRCRRRLRRGGSCRTASPSLVTCTTPWCWCVQLINQSRCLGSIRASALNIACMCCAAAETNRSLHLCTCCAPHPACLPIPGYHPPTPSPLPCPQMITTMNAGIDVTREELHWGQ